MAVASRIGVLSAVMAVYMVWAFRGLEYDIAESGPALLGLFVTFTVLAIIAAPILRRKAAGDAAAPGGELIYRFWIVSAAVIAVGWLIYYANDAAAAGEFRDNVIVGGLILAALVVVIHFVLLRVEAYLAPKRR